MWSADQHSNTHLPFPSPAPYTQTLTPGRLCTPRTSQVGIRGTAPGKPLSICLNETKDRLVLFVDLSSFLLPPLAFLSTYLILCLIIFVHLFDNLSLYQFIYLSISSSIWIYPTSSLLFTQRVCVCVCVIHLTSSVVCWSPRQPFPYGVTSELM